MDLIVCPGMVVLVSRLRLGRQFVQTGTREPTPFVVSHVHENGTVDGVLLTAHPDRSGLRAPAHAMVNVRQGDGLNEWSWPDAFQGIEVPEIEATIAPVDAALEHAEDGQILVVKAGALVPADLPRPATIEEIVDAAAADINAYVDAKVKDSIKAALAHAETAADTAEQPAKE